MSRVSTCHAGRVKPTQRPDAGRAYTDGQGDHDGLARPDLNFEAFRTHYESTHVPLALAKFGRLRRDVRNYLPTVEGKPAPPCDCITELWFDDMAALAAQAAETRGDADLETDEARFNDRVRTQTFVVDEREGGGELTARFLPRPTTALRSGVRPCGWPW